MVQSASQLRVSGEGLPTLSHCSPAVAFTMPSPQRRRVQLTLQLIDSPDVSHCSVRGSCRSTALSPHMAKTHVLRQLSSLLVLPSSHCSSRSRAPLPHFSSERQSALQPSPLTVLPSSQISSM